MFVLATSAVLLALLLAVIRAIRGPTVFDRVLAGNTVGTLAILLLASIGFLTGRPEITTTPTSSRRSRNASSREWTSTRTSGRRRSGAGCPAAA